MSDDVKIVKASNSLKKKAGMGKLDPLAVKNAQTGLENNNADFLSLAKDQLKVIKKEIDQAKGKESLDNLKINPKINKALLELKSSGPMFDYHMVGNLAGIMLNFIDQLENMDKKVLDILSAQHTIITAVIANGMKGEPDEYGRKVQADLEETCGLYLQASKKK